MISEVDYSPLPNPKLLIQYYRILENKKSNVILHMSDSDNNTEEERRGGRFGARAGARTGT